MNLQLLKKLQLKNYEKEFCMLKLLHFIVWISMWIGIGDSLVHVVWDLRSSAIHAHRHDQMSFEKFSRMLTSK